MNLGISIAAAVLTSLLAVASSPPFFIAQFLFLVLSKIMAALNSNPQGLSLGQNPIHGNDTANRKANETRARHSDHDPELGSRLYELWQLIPKVRKDGGRNWGTTSKKLIPSDQATLENLVKTMEEDTSAKEQYRYLSPNKRERITELLDEHNQRDSRYRWRYVYIDTSTRRVKVLGTYQDVTTGMDVILLRELQHQPIPAGGHSKASATKHAGPQNPGIPNNLSGGQPALGEIIRQANTQAIGNAPGVYKAAEGKGIPASGVVPSMNPQAHPQVKSPPYIFEQQPPYPQANPQVRLQGQLPAPVPQQQAHHIYQQMQHPVPSEANPAMHAIPQGVRFGGTEDQGMHRGQANDKAASKMPHPPNYPPAMNGGINNVTGPSARNGEKGRHPAHNPSTPIYTRSINEMQAQFAHTAVRDIPNPARNSKATAPPPQVVQQVRRVSHMQDDSSFMTDDESIFEEEDGYSSADSSVSSIAKGSLHRERRYIRRDAGEREHRTHYRKQSQKGHSHSGYPYTNVDILPAASSHRERETRRYRDISRASTRPVTVHGRELDTRVPGLAELNLSANETSYRLTKMEETQRSMLDTIDRLSIGLRKTESHDHIERGVTVRSIEPEMGHAVPARPVYYVQAPMYPPRRYVPREMPAYMPQPYAYDPHYF